jgi:hypothetical protein
MAYLASAYVVDFALQPEESTSATEVIIREEGTISVVVFDKKAIGAAVAQETFPKYDGLPVVIRDVGQIVFKAKGDFKPANTDSITFNLSGKAQLEWLYDDASLKKALVGKSRSEIPAILQKYPTIEKADISLRPFWSRSFPSDISKVVVQRAP